MPRRAYVSPYGSRRVIKRWRQAEDDDRDYQFIWKDLATSEGTTLSSVAYSTRQGNLTVANNSVSSGVATCTMTFTATGRKNVKMIATMADGTTHTKNILIDVYDPDEVIAEHDIWGVA